jgi:hypothetical protein
MFNVFRNRPPVQPAGARQKRAHSLPLGALGALFYYRVLGDRIPQVVHFFLKKRQD